MENKITYQEKFKIRSSEIGLDRRATLPAICNLLQEIAGNHAERLHFDITDLQEEQLTWVLHRLCVQMDRYPEWRDTITIKTWPSSGDGLRAYRDFQILDSGGATLGKSLSYWLMLNTETRRPSRIPGKILEMAPGEIQHVIPVEKADLTPVADPGSTRTFQVRESDLDLNRHVNNVRYVEWALAPLPREKRIRSIDIKFMAESVLGDTVIAGSSIQNGGTFRHQIERAADKKILALAATSR